MSQRMRETKRVGEEGSQEEREEGRKESKAEVYLG